MTSKFAPATKKDLDQAHSPRRAGVYRNLMTQQNGQSEKILIYLLRAFGLKY